jgi:hypothetical protein
MNLFGTVSALYPSEPSNFALVALFRSGELHRLTENLDTDPDNTLQQLLVVLAHLFGTLNRRKLAPETLQTAGRNSTSLMVLPALPKGVATALKRHEESIVSIFSTYAKEYAQQHTTDLGADDVLPLSGRKVLAKESADGAFASKLRQTELPVESRSLFVALSGWTDVYQSIAELTNTARAGVALQQHAVPALSSPALDSREHQLDAYAVDFFRHGSLEVLIRDNGINVSPSSLWLSDVTLT